MIDAAHILHARILIVDGEPANVAVLEQMLAEEGYDNVTSTMNPHEVVTLHRNSRYDLIVLDLQMPGVDALKLMQALKTNEQDGYLPVLVITAQPEDRLRALRAGARDFVGKPFNLVELKTRIHNALEVRLLYRQLQRHGDELEATVRERTAELRESESRYRSLTELASDWYWEQDANGNFTKVSGPVLEMLGLRVDAAPGGGAGIPVTGWNEAERTQLRAAIAERRPFLDFVFTRVNADGSQQKFQVSGEPMFGAACQLLGYRGIGVEITTRK